MSSLLPLGYVRIHVLNKSVIHAVTKLLEQQSFIQFIHAVIQLVVQQPVVLSQLLSQTQNKSVRCSVSSRRAK
jgi:Na+/citrate or Na+/malate symporter